LGRKERASVKAAGTKVVENMAMGVIMTESMALEVIMTESMALEVITRDHMEEKSYIIWHSRWSGQ